MSSPGPTPGERVAAFWTAVDEELLRPARRYLRGFRAGLVLGLALGLLVTPWPGAAVRARMAALRRRACRRRRERCG